MELSIRITEEDFVKDKELFSKLKNLLKASVVDTSVEQTVKVNKELTPVTEPIVEQPTSQPIPVTETVQTVVPTIQAAEYTFNQLAVACTSLMDNGKQNELIGLLNNKFGVAALPNLPKEKFNEFAVAIREMGAQI